MTKYPEAIIQMRIFRKTFKLNVKEVSRKNAQDPPSPFIAEIS